MESEDERVESETALSLERKTKYRTRKRKSRKEQIKFARACKQAKRTRNMSDEMSAVQSERTQGKIERDETLVRVQRQIATDIVKLLYHVSVQEASKSFWQTRMWIPQNLQHMQDLFIPVVLKVTAS